MTSIHRAPRYLAALLPVLLLAGGASAQDAAAAARLWTLTERLTGLDFD